MMGAGPDAAMRLLGEAFESGIRHFDTAPAYGAGDAEATLGRFLVGRRSQVTITTKFGIDPPERTPALRFAIRVGRQLASVIPASRTTLSKAMPKAPLSMSRFNRAAAQLSLERSLRSLRTDYVDYYLLHEYSVDYGQDAELFGFLQACWEGGKIKAVGVGTSFPQIQRLLAGLPHWMSVLQFESSVLRRNIEKLPLGHQRTVLTHGALGRSYRWLAARLKSDPRMATEWTRSLGEDVRSSQRLAALMLDFALRIKGGRFVLFSSKSPTRVAANALIEIQPPVSQATSELFGMLVARDCPEMAD